MLLSDGAAAQAWLKDRSTTEGPGFKVGRLELHPGIGTEIGYDSNAFLTDSGREGVAILRATAHLDLATRSQKRRTEGEDNLARSAKVDFRTGLAGSYLHYFFDRLDDNVEGQAKLDTTFNPDGVVGLRIHDEFTRTARPFTDPNTASGTAISFGQNNNVAGMEVRFQSRGGVLKAHAGYDFEFTIFDDSQFDYTKNFTHRPRAGLAWQFFPSTALVFETNVALQDYRDPTNNAASLVTDNIRVNSTLGINGALTEKVSVSGAVGYAVGFYDAQEDFDSVTARAEVRWKPRRTATVKLGFIRRFEPSYIGNFNRSNRLYLDTNFLFGGAFLLGIDSWVSFDRSGIAFQADGVTQVGDTLRRKDTRLHAGLYAEYRATDWFGITGTVGYAADFTDFDFNNTGMATLVDSAGSYQRVEGWFGVRVFY